MNAVVLGMALMLSVKLLVSGWQSRNRVRVAIIENRIGVSTGSSAGAFTLVINRLQNLLAGNFLNPWGSDEFVTQTLIQAGDSRSTWQFRRSQVISMLTMHSAIISWALLRNIFHKPIPLSFLSGLFVFTIPFSGWALMNLLRNQVAIRSQRIDQQLGGILELLAFCVSAGEPVILAIERVTILSSCDAARVLSEVPNRLASGSSIAQALSACANQTASESFGRSIRALQTALDRGTPIAGVLRAQAASARSLNQQYLMQLAGKKEAAMMMPVVFFILPMIVFIALYPGLSALQLA